MPNLWHSSSMWSRLTFLNWIEVGNVKSCAGGLALSLGLPTFHFLGGCSTFMASLSRSRGISCSDIIMVSEWWSWFWLLITFMNFWWHILWKRLIIRHIEIVVAVLMATLRSSWWCFLFLLIRRQVCYGVGLRENRWLWSVVPIIACCEIFKYSG